MDKCKSDRKYRTCLRNKFPRIGESARDVYRGWMVRRGRWEYCPLARRTLKQNQWSAWSSRCPVSSPCLTEKLTIQAKRIRVIKVESHGKADEA